ncbi:hypothetical protein EsH8_IX_001004 [Colletotrichum jinshuiense]
MEEEGIKKHNEAVAAIAEKIKKFFADGIQFRVYHGDTNKAHLATRKADPTIDMSRLNQIIAIDKDRRVALVQPNVTMDAFVTATLKHGLLPQVVPEFPGITVGGSFSGTAAESSSFKFGYFDQSVNWAEFILANGDVVKASANDNADLFYGAAGACDTLGIGTLLEIKLIDACRFVEVRYLPVHSMAEALAKIKEYTDNISFVNFVDAIIFGPTSGAVIIGTLTDEAKPGIPIVRFTRRQDPWYYLHVHGSVAHARHTCCDTCSYSSPRSAYEKGIVTNLVPVVDYLFRYNRGAFWMGIYGQKPVFFNKSSYYIMNPLMQTRVTNSIIHHNNKSQAFIVQDLAIPQQSAEDFLTWSNDKLHVYPLWLCPIKATTNAPLHIANRPADTKTIINIGLWGLKTSNWPFFQRTFGHAAFERFIDDNRAIEAKVRELGGLKWLYAHNYSTEDEFWSVYNKEEYDQLRKKWGASGLPSLWDKTNNAEGNYMEKESFWKTVVLTMLGRGHVVN